MTSDISKSKPSQFYKLTDSGRLKPVKEIRPKLSIKNPWLLFLLFAMAYLALNYIALAGEDFLKVFITKGKKGWGIYAIVAIVLLIILYIIAKVMNVPFIEFEQI